MDLVGGVDSQGSYVSKILCVKMKESGPLGAMRRVRPPGPGFCHYNFPNIISASIDIDSNDFSDTFFCILFDFKLSQLGNIEIRSNKRIEMRILNILHCLNVNVQQQAIFT